MLRRVVPLVPIVLFNVPVAVPPAAMPPAAAGAPAFPASVASLTSASAASTATPSVETARSSPALGRDWSPPADGPLLRTFDPPARPWSAGHRGADWGSPDGRVLAPGAGTVSFAGPVAGRPVITVSHGGGLFSSLEPVTALPGLEVGDRVEAGDPLGTISSAHCLHRCVHWGLRLRDGWVVEGTAWDRYLDPLVVLGLSGPSVLWPLDGGPPAGAVPPATGDAE